MTALSIALVGCGKMGSALVRGWLGASMISRIDILEPGDIPFTGDKSVHHVRDGAPFRPDPGAPWDMLVLAVKPQILSAVCTDIAPNLPPSLPVLSIAAGKTIGALKSVLGSARPVIRAMPNTPAAIGQGISVAVASPEVTPGQRHIAQQILSAGGTVRWVEDETQMDAVTALSGSGPAYVFHLIDIMAQAGVKAGLPADLSMDLAQQTVIGAAALAEAEKDTPPGTLRQNVTSPGGTTEAALSILMDGRWQKLFDEAILKAAARSRELSR